MTNHDKKTNFLTGITLEGFQVFDKPTYIPLESLTLLFGPNSAGKSAVQDALDLFNLLKNININDSYGSINNDLRNLLKRHWRKTEDNNKYVEKMSISIIQNTETPIYTAVASELNRGMNFAEFSTPLKIECKWNFSLVRNYDEKTIYNDEEEEYKNKEIECRKELLLFHHDFEYFIESKFFLSYKQAELKINLNNTFFKGIEKKINFNEVVKAYPLETSLIDGYFTIHSAVINFQAFGLDVEKRKEKWLDYYPFGMDNADQTLFRAALAELSLLIGYFLLIANNESEFKIDKVDASRTVPTAKQLTFRLGNLDDTWEKILAEPATIFRSMALREDINLGDSLRHIIQQGDLKYIMLAESLASEFIKNARNKIIYANKINLALSENLFLERGYRIDFDIRAVLSKIDFQAVRSGIKLDSDNYGFFVELFLRDGQGRKHFFNDVGSGIGYILPVLCSIFNPKFSTSFIQQPELHIHPALQAAMGDVFIEARNGGNKQILIETHSEHLLLRILKRIRQTHLQAHVAPELKINADDVCVLYFDPLPDGTTIVKRLRITEDGEFMDRWPRGFFGERDQELLDE